MRHSKGGCSSRLFPPSYRREEDQKLEEDFGSKDLYPYVKKIKEKK
jgi:hypothetical protein